MVKAIFSSDTRGSIPSTAPYGLAPDIIFLPVQDGTARLLDLNGHFYAVTAIGAQMLQEALEQNTAAAVQKIAAQYGVDTRQVQTDLQVFLHGLERRRLICRPAPSRSRHQTNTTAPFLILAPFLRFAHKNHRALETKIWILLTLARLSFRLFGWSKTIAAWQRYYGTVSIDEAVRDHADTVKTVDDTVRAVAAEHVFGMECKERALCCWALMRSAGLPAAVVLGINLFPLASHCWCEVSSWTLSDYQDRCEKFAPVMRYE